LYIKYLRSSLPKLISVIHLYSQLTTASIAAVIPGRTSKKLLYIDKTIEHAQKSNLKSYQKIIHRYIFGSGDYTV